MFFLSPVSSVFHTEVKVSIGLGNIFRVVTSILQYLISMLNDANKYNQSKTEVCVFHKNDPPRVNVRVENVYVKSKKSINVLGVTFDSKLNWGEHISNTICKAKKSLYALRLLRKFFNFQEMRTLLDSYFYSILYYNCEIWLTPDINSTLKQSLFAYTMSKVYPKTNYALQSSH